MDKLFPRLVFETLKGEYEVCNLVTENETKEVYSGRPGAGIRRIVWIYGSAHKVGDYWESIRYKVYYDVGKWICTIDSVEDTYEEENPNSLDELICRHHLPNRHEAMKLEMKEVLTRIDENIKNGTYKN